MWYSAEQTVDLTLFEEPISILQDNDTVHVGTSVWEASLVFAKWVEKNESNPGHPFSRAALDGKRAIELGAGCGLSAFALALAGCNTVASDIPAVLPILKKNIKRNMARVSPRYTARHGPVKKVKPAVLQWGHAAQIAGVKPPFDIVVATDVVYLEETVHPLIQTLVGMCGPHSVVCLGYRLRQQEAHDLFWKELPQWFTVAQVAREELHEEYGFEDVNLYMLQLKPGIKASECVRS